jgi:selenocysteine lyase/cysteine desulfurase
LTALDGSRFPITRTGLRWFDHAGASPLSMDAVDAIARWASAVATDGRATAEPTVATVRALAGDLLGVAAADLAFTGNTTEGIGLVAAGIRWSDDDRVVVAECEFPSNLYPWLMLRERGVRVDVVPLASLSEAVGSGPRPTVVAASWVQYARGERIDLAALAHAAHARGALLVADVIQGTGAIPCDLAAWDVDIAVTGGHKWLLGPAGTGLVYVSERARDVVHPFAPGWASVTPHDDYADYRFELLPDARRFEGGTQATGLLAGLGASIMLLQTAGVPSIWEHIDGLCDRLIEGLPSIATVLSDRSAGGRSGIVTFALDGIDPAWAVGELRRAGFVLRARGGGMRFAPHGYTSPDDVDAFLATIRAWGQR